FDRDRGGFRDRGDRGADQGDRGAQDRGRPPTATRPPLGPPEREGDRADRPPRRDDRPERREFGGRQPGRDDRPRGDRPTGLSALQHLVNLMLSKRMGDWTRVLVDVEDYRGRRERQLRDLATRAALRVAETGKMLQLEPMPALERRWIHIALRDHSDVATQS